MDEVIEAFQKVVVKKSHLFYKSDVDLVDTIAGNLTRLKHRIIKLEEEDARN